MVYQKIKKSQNSLGGIFLSLILVLGFFFLMYGWISSNATESGRVIDATYNDTFNRLAVQQGNLSDTVTGLRDSATQVTEAGTDFGVALNGLKGLLNVFKIPFNLISIGVESLHLLTNPLSGVIPQIVITLIELGIIVLIILIIIAIFKGDSKLIN